MPDPNDLRQTGKNLALSDPFMQIGQAIASVGQAVQSGEVPQSVKDAYESIKQHLASGGKTLQDASSTLLKHVSDAVMPKLHAEEAEPSDAQPAKSQKYRIKLDDGSQFDVTTVDGKPPSEDEVMAYLKDNPTVGKAPEKAPGSGLGTMQTALQGVKDFGIGAAKGAAHTAIDLGSAVHMIPGVSTAVDKLYGTPGLSSQAFDQARQATAYSNPTQQLGGAAETVAEMAIPVDAGVQALPSAGRAARGFQATMGAARNIPVNVEPAGQAALRVQQLAERGATMPKAVNDFLKYVTNPDKPALTYEAGRDFLTNLGKLSVSERLALNKPVQREVAIMTGNLAKSVAEAAAKAGKGEVYAKAMTEYGRAKRLEAAYDTFLKGAQKGALPAAIAGGGAGAGYWLTKQLANILGGE